MIGVAGSDGMLMHIRNVTDSLSLKVIKQLVNFSIWKLQAPYRLIVDKITTCCLSRGLHSRHGNNQIVDSPNRPAIVEQGIWLDEFRMKSAFLVEVPYCVADTVFFSFRLLKDPSVRVDVEVLRSRTT